MVSLCCMQHYRINSFTQAGCDVRDRLSFCSYRNSSAIKRGQKQDGRVVVFLYHNIEPILKQSSCSLQEVFKYFKQFSRNLQALIPSIPLINPYPFVYFFTSLFRTQFFPKQMYFFSNKMFCVRLFPALIFMILNIIDGNI